MKNKSIILFLFFSAFNIFTIHCQSKWFAPEDVWYFTTPYELFLDEYCTKVEISGDTIIKGLDCKIMSFKDVGSNKTVATEYLHYRNDSVLYFNYYQDAYYLLYDFTANEGDTIVVHQSRFKPTDGFLYNSSDSIYDFRYVVTKIDSVQISGTWLKRQQVKPVKHGNWGFFDSAYIIEKLGSLGYFFGELGFSTGMLSKGNLRCFSDHSIQYKNQNWDKECGFVTSIKEPQISDILIYPNPANKEINVESIDNKNILSVEIMDIDGRILAQKEVNKRMAKIDVGSLSSGIYFARIVFTNKTYLTSKFLISEHNEK